MENDAIVRFAKITTHKPRLGAGEYEIKDYKQAGLKEPSVIRFSRRETIKRSLIPESDYIGHLSERDIQNIKQAHLEQTPIRGSLEEGLSRDEMIAELKKLGKGYYNFDRYSDKQLFMMLQRILSQPRAQIHKITKPEVCPECGTLLADNGSCPKCDPYDEFPLED